MEYRVKKTAVALIVATALAGCSAGSGAPSTPMPTPTVAPSSVAASPTKPSPTAIKAAVVSVPDLVGRTGNKVDQALLSVGLKAKFQEKDGTSNIVVRGNWTVVEQSPVAGESVPRGTVVTVRVKRKEAPSASTQAASALDASTVSQACADEAQQRLLREGYRKVKVHWMTGVIVSEPRGDAWFTKIQATAGSINLNVECTVAGAGDNSVVSKVAWY